MNRSEDAQSLFLSGHNCAQSVLISFAEELKYSKELALKLAAGFGGGMGKQQKTCGAVTGAIMVLGILAGEKVNSNDALKSQSYSDVKDMVNQFKAEFGTTECKELVGCDLNTPEGSAKFKEDQIMERICAPCVGKAVDIVESMTR